MDNLRKFSGIVWLALGLYAGFFSITNLGLPKLSSGFAGNQSDLVFGIIVVFILTPIIVGSLVTFGYYALTGEYDKSRQ
jgi:hypothetical protein